MLSRGEARAGPSGDNGLRRKRVVDETSKFSPAVKRLKKSKRLVTSVNSSLQLKNHDKFAFAFKAVCEMTIERRVISFLKRSALEIGRVQRCRDGKDPGGGLSCHQHSERQDSEQLPIADPTDDQSGLCCGAWNSDCSARMGEQVGEQVQASW